MASDSNYFLKKTLGEDFFESLTKFELWKPGTKTTIDHEEIKTALMIVPRAIMSYLIHELTPMGIGQTKEIGLSLKIEHECMVRVTKHERDVYSGEVLEDNKIIVDFKYRSIPGVGLVIMSAFELYNVDRLEQDQKDAPSEDITKKVQSLIDERLALHDLIGKVVDKKIEERDAIKQLLMAKITQDLEHSKKLASDVANMTKIQMEMAKETKDEYFRGMANGLEVVNSSVNKKEPQFLDPIKNKKESPLKGFLDNRKNKSTPKAEFSVEMAKGEHVNCPDCKKNIFDGEAFSGCVCLGDDMNKKIYIKKTEDGVKIRFGHGWDKENIEMLLEVLRSKRG